MYDITIVGAGVAGASFALKISKYAKVLLIEEQEYEKNIPLRTNIFAEHNRPFINEVDWTNKEIFPLSHITSNYMSEKEDGIVNSKEFGIPLGNVCYTENLIRFFIHGFEKHGGITKFNEKITRVNKHKDFIEIINNKGESYSTKLLVLATGSRALHLQESLSFGVPDQYKGICMHMYGNEEQIRENFDYQYIFHLNPNINKNGPFFINVGVERIFIGFLGDRNESNTELISKLDRIINNYKRIQPYLQGLRKGSDIVVGEISKHPIENFSNDRIILLGECAGLVTSFFYEGILSGLASADIAASTLKPLLETNSNFTKTELNKYDQEVRRILFKYYKNGDQCEYLFYNSSNIKMLWNTYCGVLKRDKTARKYIYDAYINQDLANHDLSKDRYVGEKFFGKLPALTKIAMGPKFLKALFK